MSAALRLMLCGFALALFGARAHGQTPTVSIPGINAANYPRVNGSSSTAPLSQLVLARALGLDAQMRNGQKPPKEPAQPNGPLIFAPATSAQELAEFARLQRANAHSGTHESYEALIGGRADLILVARPPSPAEAELAAREKVELRAQAVARDGLIFVVNRANPVNGLTQAQLRAIFIGETTQWNTVGGADEPIRAYTRNANSGSEELMRALLMQGAPVFDGGEREISSMAGLLDAIARNPRALGYSIFYYETQMNSRAENKTLAIEGVAPSRASIADGSYPLVAPVYLVTRGDLAPDAPAARLRDWLLSAPGQSVVEQSGYIANAPGN